MKKTAVIISIFFATLKLEAQVIVDNVNVNKQNVEYIELIGTAKTLNPFKTKVYIDYGQKMSWKEQTIKNLDGKNYAFNGMIEALNFMDKNGWEYVNNYIVEVNGKMTYKYLMRRKK